MSSAQKFEWWFIHHIGSDGNLYDSNLIRVGQPQTASQVIRDLQKKYPQLRGWIISPQFEWPEAEHEYLSNLSWEVQNATNGSIFK